MHAIATVAVTPRRYLLQSLRLSGSDHEHPFLHTSQTLVLHFSFSKAEVVFISPCVSTIRTWPLHEAAPTDSLSKIPETQPLENLQEQCA